jgi:TRAP-type C4-dicarboxylate transport system permease small subunit
MTMSRVRQGFESLLSIIVVALLLILAVEVMIGVVFRVIGNPLAWYDEVAAVLLAWLSYYGAALAALKRAHIGFPGLVQAMPPALRVPVVLFAEACVFAFFILLAWYGWKVLGILGDQTLVTVDLPVTLTQSVIPIGAILFIIAEALCLPDLLRAARDERASLPESDVAKEVTH